MNQTGDEGIKFQNIGVMKESSWMITNSVVEESNWIITGCWCDGGIKLYTCCGGSRGTSNRIITECWGGGEHEKFCSHKAIKFVCVWTFFHMAEIFDQFDIGCFAILQMQHVSLWSELWFFCSVASSPKSMKHQT